MSDRPLLSVRDLTLGYGDVPVLRDVNLEVRRGERWFVLGPNGAGKSTLMAALVGILAPLAGAIARDPCDAAPARVGYVPQRCEWGRHLPTTVREFVGMGLVGVAIGGPERRRRVVEALAEIGLAGMERRDYGALSGGQRQRALVARALVRHPALLLFDEPATGLDAQAETALMEALARRHAREAVASVLISHDLSAAFRHATHVAFVHGGRVRAVPAGDAALRAAVEDCYGVRVPAPGQGGAR